MATARERALAALDSSAAIYRTSGILNPHLGGGEPRRVALLECVFLLEWQLAVLEAGDTARPAATNGEAS